MNSAFLKSAGHVSHGPLWPALDSADQDNSVARYGRVAMVEVVLSIRDRQQRVVRRIVVASLVLTGIAVIVAGFSGWL